MQSLCQNYEWIAKIKELGLKALKSGARWQFLHPPFRQLQGQAVKKLKRLQVI